MSILSTNHRLISIGESYSAGNGIDITDQVISVTGDATPYSAGDNIDIQGHVISGKDWSQDITDASSNAFNETTAWVHDNYANSADVSYLSSVVDNKLDTSAWSSVSSNFATEDYVIMADNITYDRTTGYVENQQFAKESACQSAFEQLNTNKLDASSFTDWQNGQYSTDLQTIEGQIANKYDTSSFAEASGNFQPKGDYAERDFVLSSIESATSGKLDVSSFASVSSDFLTTSFEIPESATWNEVSTTVQSNSAQWADGGTGDEEVNSFVYNNSATIYEVNTAYQTHSASYQPSGNYIPYTGYDAVKGYAMNKPLTVEGELLGMKTKVAGAAIFLNSNDAFGLNTQTTLTPYHLNFSGKANGSAQVDISSINKWNDVSTTVQSNSAQWAEGGGGSNPEVESYVINNSATIDEVNTTYQSNSANYLTAHQSLTNYYTTAEANTLSSMLSGAIDYVSANAGGNVPVSNSGDLYKVEFDGVDLYGYKKTTTIPHYDYTAMKSSTGTYINIDYRPTFDNVGFSSNVGWFYNADIITFSSNGDGIAPSEYDSYTTALDVYYKASNLYDWYNNQLDDFSGYIGKITLDNLVTSSYLKKPSYFNNIFRCGKFDLWFSSNIDRDGFPSEYVLSLVDESLTSTSTVEGIFVPSALPTYEYDNTNKISAINGSAIAAGDEFPASADEAVQYVQTNSAQIDDTATAFQTNSSTYMVEPNLGYNAVGEISGYGNSAIAQYGAEKQWLVHDDTLVHAANSAQYALGVNLSAVAQLLGVDETVLFSGTRAISTTGQFNLSENPTNFKKIEIWARSYPDYNETLATVVFCDGIHTKFPFVSVGINDGLAAIRFNASRFDANSSGFNIVNQKQFSITGTNCSTADSPSIITKVIGIGRKA